MRNVWDPRRLGFWARLVMMVAGLAMVIYLIWSLQSGNVAENPGLQSILNPGAAVPARTGRVVIDKPVPSSTPAETPAKDR